MACSRQITLKGFYFVNPIRELQTYHTLSTSSRGRDCFFLLVFFVCFFLCMTALHQWLLVCCPNELVLYSHFFLSVHRKWRFQLKIKMFPAERQISPVSFLFGSCQCHFPLRYFLQTMFVS